MSIPFSFPRSSLQVDVIKYVNVINTTEIVKVNKMMKKTNLSDELYISKNRFQRNTSKLRKNIHLIIDDNSCI